MRTTPSKGGATDAEIAQSGKSGGIPAPCRCKYQQEKNWGYEAFKWHRNKWKAVGRSSSVLDAMDIVDKCKCILIVCRGCGAWMFNEPIPATGGEERKHGEHKRVTKSRAGSATDALSESAARSDAEIGGKP